MGGDSGILAFFGSHWKMIKQDQFLVLTILFLGLVFPLMPRYIIAPWDNYRFVLMAIFPFLCFLNILFNEKDFKLKIISTDIGWFIFISICFLSFFWAVNGSLIWYQAFGWLNLILWMLLFRSFSTRESFQKYLPKVFFALFFIIALPIVFISFIEDLSVLAKWNHHFGFNINFTTTLLLSLFPFLIFYKVDDSLTRILQFLGLGIVLYILYFFDKRGPILASTVIGLYFVWCQLSQKYIKYLFNLGLVIFLSFAVILVVNFDEIANNLGIADLATYSGDSARIHSISCAIRMFLEEPFLGKGLGNWYVEAYKNDLSEVVGFDNPFILYRPANHTIYSQYLAEIGIIGTVAFLLPILSVFWKGWRFCYQLSSFQKAAFSSLLIYLVAGMVYRDANFYEFHFSGIQLLGFCALGILTSNSEQFSIMPKWGNVLLGLTIFISVGGFIYYLNTYYTYQKVLELSKDSTTELGFIKNYDSSINYNRTLKGGEESIQLLEAIYNPLFMNNLGFYQDGHQTGANRSLALRLAQLYLQQNQGEKAEIYFQEALKKAPYDEYILINYAKFLLRIKKETTKAKKYALKVYNIQKNNFDFNLLLAEIAIEEEEFIKAKGHLAILTDKLAVAYGYSNLRTLLLAEIAMQEKEYHKAKAYLDQLNIKENQNYSNLVENLQSRLEQATNTN